MRWVFLIFFLLFINHCSLIVAQSGWMEYSTGITRPVRDIYFVNANTGWAVGDSAILKSTNGGLNWTPQYFFFYYGMPCYFKSVRFINENTGYTVGGHFAGGPYDFYYAYIYKTTNGGENWNIMSIPLLVGSAIHTRVFPVTENIIFVSSSGSFNMGASGGVAKSTNSGVNWLNNFSKGECNALYCLNADTAWISTYFWSDYPAQKGCIYKTTNGGVNWVEQYKDSLYNATLINSVQFINKNTGFAVGQKYYTNKTKFFKTTNGGTTWDTLLLNNNKYRSVFFIDQNTGWIGGGNSSDTSCISYTTNGGLNWTSQKKNYVASVSNLFFINSLTGWAALGSPNILKTTNGGITFANQISTTVPEKFSLYQNYPNPFNPYTKIKFEIPPFYPPLGKGGNGGVSLKVFDITGREIQILVNEQLSPGTYEVTFDGSNLPSGIYFYQLRSGDFLENKKIILIK